MGNSLNNISPIDGRYFKLTKELNNYFKISTLKFLKVKYQIEFYNKYNINLFNRQITKNYSNNNNYFFLYFLS